MAKKRIGDIASAHDLNPKEVVKQLQEAGFSVQSPTSTIDERLALKVLGVGGNGAGAGAGQKPEPAKPQQPRRVQAVGQGQRGQQGGPRGQGQRGPQGGQRGGQGGQRGGQGGGQGGQRGPQGQ